MEYHLVNILILLFLLTYIHIALTVALKSQTTRMQPLKMVWQLEVPWQNLSKKGPSQMLW